MRHNKTQANSGFVKEVGSCLIGTIAIVSIRYLASKVTTSNFGHGVYFEYMAWLVRLLVASVFVAVTLSISKAIKSHTLKRIQSFLEGTKQSMQLEVLRIFNENKSAQTFTTSFS